MPTGFTVATVTAGSLLAELFILVKFNSLSNSEKSKSDIVASPKASINLIVSPTKLTLYFVSVSTFTISFRYNKPSNIDMSLLNN